jgi:hypothetical protein
VTRTHERGPHFAGLKTQRARALARRALRRGCARRGTREALFHQFTNALRAFSGSARTFFEAGFALKIILSLPLLDSSLKKYAAEKMLSRIRFGAQHITAFPVRKRIFLRRARGNALFSRLRSTCGSR